MRSDVPVGLFLSSGIDSATILAIMSQHVSNPIYTFTIGFEGGEKTNETDDARQIAARYGAIHTEMIVGPEDYEKYYERYLWDIEEPVGNETAAAFYFVSKIAGEKVKVALTGQGADEPWAGYHRHLGVKLSNIYSRLPHSLTDLAKDIVHLLPRSERLKRGVTALHEPDMLARFAKIYSFYSAEMKGKLFQNWVKQEISLNGYEAKEALRRLYSDVQNLDPLTQMLYIDTRANLPDDLLMVNDKTSMANSIEARVPFLDYRLVEFIETIPSNLKIKGFRGKHLHKKAVEKWLPKTMINRKKKGFDNPIDQWLRSKMFSYVEDCLLSEKSAVNEYFNRNYVNELIKLHEERKEDYLRHIYLLISFELWHRQFISN
jgi:asparagine synthase (glutamine-hydrolysing)